MEALDPARPHDDGEAASAAAEIDRVLYACGMVVPQPGRLLVALGGSRPGHLAAQQKREVGKVVAVARERDRRPGRQLVDIELEAM